MTVRPIAPATPRAIAEPSHSAIGSLRAAADALGVAIDFSALEEADRRFDTLLADTREWLGGEHIGRGK